jgi:apolipoprotein N-acyltransferase
MAQLVLISAILIGVRVYGQWRLSQAERCIQAGPIVASLQSNVPQSVKRTFKSSDLIFSELSSMGSEVGHMADLVIWPETSVQAILDQDLWPLLDDLSSHAGQRYDLGLKQQAKANSCNILVGAYGGRIGQDTDGHWILDRFNSAFLYRPDGTRDPDRYDKIHLVLFGEYLPFRHNFRWLYRILMHLTPYNYDYSLEPGTKHTRFTIHPAKGNGPHCRLAVLICYEDTIPDLARKAVLDPNGQKMADGIVNISNDGWFVRFLEGSQQVRPSTELIQHLAACTFRAIENRVSVVRSVNTGISCIIDPCGRILDGGMYLSKGMPEQALRRTGLAGIVVDRLPIDTRIAPFSRFGQWLDDLCATAFLACLGLAGLKHRIGKKKG